MFNVQCPIHIHPRLLGAVVVNVVEQVGMVPPKRLPFSLDGIYQVLGDVIHILFGRFIVNAIWQGVGCVIGLAVLQFKKENMGIVEGVVVVVHTGVILLC